MNRQALPRFRDATYLGPRRTLLVVPSFTLEVPIWAGASSVIQQYQIGNVEPFSLRLPISAFADDCVFAIRWKDETLDICYRFKLYDHAGALLYYPLYAGEAIGANATLEVWSVNASNAPTLATDTSLESSWLSFPNDQASSVACTACCTENQQVITLSAEAPSVLPPGAACNPFCFNLC